MVGPSAFVLVTLWEICALTRIFNSDTDEEEEKLVKKEKRKESLCASRVAKKTSAHEKQLRFAVVAHAGLSRSCRLAGPAHGHCGQARLPRCGRDKTLRAPCRQVLGSA